MRVTRPSSRRALHAALSGWLVGLLAVGPAAAQTPLPLRLAPRALPAAAAPAVTVVAIGVDGADRAEVARLGYEAEQAVARSGRLALVRLADALDARGRGEREARDAEAALAMKEGQRAYDDLDTQKALQQFDKAVRAYETADLSRRFGELSRARVMKAASQVANGENTAAQLEIRAVLAVDPRAQFSPNFFPPEQMAFVEKERKAVLAGPRAPVRVSTEPVPAQVYVDGQFRGVSPVELTDLPAADHYVTVVAPGYEVAQGRVREGAAALKLTPVAAQKSLQTLSERVARKPDGEARDEALRELGALAGVPQVLAVLVRGGTGSAPLEVTALRLDVADGHNLAYAPGTVARGGGLEAGAQALLEPLVAADAPRQGGKPVTHFASGGGTRRTVGYVLMGTGLALLASGVYFGLEASAKQDELERTPQRDPDSEDLRSTGKTYALVADVGILAGLASAGIGTWLAFSGGGGGAAPPRAKRAEPTPAPAPAPTPAPEPRREALPMPPPPKSTKPAGEALPMPPPPSRASPSSQPASPPPAPARPADSRKARAEEERKQREAEEQRKQEEAEAKRKQEEAEAKRRQQEAEAKKKREEEERRRREEEEKKKKRPALDEDDLRNY